MKIQDCKFTMSNIRVAINEDGIVMLGNAETNQIYCVNIVTQLKVTKPKGAKVIKIKRRSEYNE